MSSPPKRDKFAALAARQTETTTSSPDNTGTSTTNTISNTTTSTSTSTTNNNTNSPPKRDKLSAMAARQHSNVSGNSPPDHAPTSATDAGSAQTATTIAPPRRRDKFASAHSTLQETAEKHRKQQHEESHRKELAQKCQQRDAVWRDLERAEALTVRLLDLAHDAASYWSHPDDQNKKQPLSVEPFQTTLQEIHTALHPHAALVQAYQAPQKTNRMYQSRVEWRLAESRKEILKEYLELEKTTSSSSSSNKRSQEPEQDPPDPPTKQAKTQETS